MRKYFFQAVLLFFALSGAWAQPPLEPDDSKPLPDIMNAPYGPHERNVLDFWQANKDHPEKPAPVMIYFHGGGFVGGEKRNLDADLLDRCLKAGISVASANYRFSRHAMFPGPMHDGARAIQYLRLQADRFKLDPARIAAWGNSAGAGITLWLGYHDDLKDESNSDPVLRQSSRVVNMGVWGAQCSYDPRFIKKEIGGRAYEHPALLPLFGITREELDSPKAYALYEQANMINLVTPDDPPVFMYYVESKDPLPPSPNTTDKLDYPQFGDGIEGWPNAGWGIHHPRFGELLLAKLHESGVEGVLRHALDYKSEAGEDPRLCENLANEEFVKFMQARFTRRKRINTK